MATVLFGLSSSFSYTYVNFVVGLDMVCDLLDFPIHVSTPVGDFVVVDMFYRSHSIMFMGYQTWPDLVILDMVDIDRILDMSWLSLYHDILDCYAKTVIVAMPGMNRLE